MRSLGILIALGGTAAAAPPLAKLDADIDGDGVADHVELRADGTLAIGAKTVKLGPAVVTGGTLAASRANKRPMLVVTVTGSAKQEAVIFDRGAEVSRFEIGGASVERDFTLDVDADPRWLIRFQRVGGAERCDGKPALLFPEAFDADGKTWKSVKPPIDVDDAAPAIAAKLESGAGGAAPLVYKAHLASHVPGAPDAGALGVPTELDDGRADTVWTEALDSDGKGQFFTFEPRSSGEPAKTLRLVPGDPRSAAALRASNRPKRLAIATAQGAWWVEVPDPVATKAPLGAAYTIELPVAVTGCVTAILAETYAGDGGKNATSIAELEVYSANEAQTGGEVMLAHAIAEGTAPGANAATILATRGAAGARAITAELVKTTDPRARERLVRVLAQIKDPAAAPALVDAAQHGWVTGADLIAAIDALGGLDQTVALVAIARERTAVLAARIAAVRHIDAARDANAIEALLELAATLDDGKGGASSAPPLPARAPAQRPGVDDEILGIRDLRAAVIDALAAAPIDGLLAAAGQTPDVWRAVTKQLRGKAATADARAKGLAAMATALAAATTYEQRYRLIDGLAALGDAAALGRLAHTLAALPSGSGSESAALRQVAIRAIATSPRIEAVPLVMELVRDGDPGVRLAAIAALATTDAEPTGPWRSRGGPDGVDRAIASVLATDRWPDVRRRAAEALGERCTRTGPAAALAAALAGDRAVPVRIDALAALVQCKAPDIARTLQRTWDDKHAPLELRAYAVDLAVILGDRKLGDVLVDRFGSWQNASTESKEALELAQHAAPAIGRLAPKDAVDVLVDALGDTAYPELVSAAAIGLASLGPACTPAAKQKLLAVAVDDEQVAVVAKRAAMQCGRRE